MKIQILGTRGVPAQHGGFETFAESLALYLVDRGHDVIVYCQSEKPCALYKDTWRGVQRIHIYGASGAFGTIWFDLRAVLHSLQEPFLPLILGYNTACFSVLYRICGKSSLMNMDGIEWKREKWSWIQRLWLRFNEYAGAKLSTHLVADHPAIATHLLRHVEERKLTVIPYGADQLKECEAGDDQTRLVLRSYGLLSKGYALVIARPEPENSLLEIVQAFSAKRRGLKLFVLGRLSAEESAYHRKVIESASDEVIFPGAIYDKAIVAKLRLHARVYLHGHRVGGTNPSLVEALAARNAVIAHDNEFTRWVAGSEALFFSTAQDLMTVFDLILGSPSALERMQKASEERYLLDFKQENILSAYEALLMRFYTNPKRKSGRP